MHALLRTLHIFLVRPGMMVVNINAHATIKRSSVRQDVKLLQKMWMNPVS